MTPDEHARTAERLLREADRFHATSPVRGSLERQAIAHATLSLREPARRTTKKTTTPKETTK